MRKGMAKKMKFFFNLFSYRVEKEFPNVYEAYDYFMELIEKFSIDMKLAREYYSLINYSNTFDIPLTKVKERWPNRKKTTVRHCHFGVLETNFKVTRVRIGPDQLSNLKRLIKHGPKAVERVESFMKYTEQTVLRRGGVTNVHAS